MRRNSFRPLTGTYTRRSLRLPGSIRDNRHRIATKLQDRRADESSAGNSGLSADRHCWDQKEIVALWEDLNGIIADRPYHLGTIILQHRENRYEVVDGQQRLVTLTLLLWGLGYTGSLPLLAQRFPRYGCHPSRRQCKAVIRSLIQPLPDNELQDRIIGCVTFRFLSSKAKPDLACTFSPIRTRKGSN